MVINLLSLVLCLIGGFGIVAATVFFPCLARFLYCFRKKNKSSKIISQSVAGTAHLISLKKIAIIIPAHNEEAVLDETLMSIHNAINDFNLQYKRSNEIKFEIFLGADCCSDKTVEIAKKNDTSVIEFSKPQGKWNVLKQLVAKQEDVDWISLVDAGIAWEKNLLIKILPDLNNENCVGIFPAYFKKFAGAVEKYTWKLERFLKNYENYAGGPITSHGATVFFRADVLKLSFEKLSQHDWLNDDVVLPLMVRLQDSENITRYRPDVQLIDYSCRPNVKREFKRRIRLVQGNVEWIRELCRYACVSDVVVTTLLLRRVCRLLWAYWGGAIVFGMVLTVNISCITLLIVLALMCVISIWKFGAIRGMLEAAVASLLVPFYFVRKGKREW